MPRIVRGALVQATWTGDKESMIQKHEQRAHDAKAQGAQLVLFQELFYGPYFCQVQDPQYYAYTELIPDGPTTKRMQALAKELGVVLVVPMYEEDSQASGVYYNTAAVIDADGSYLGKYRKTHIPHVKGFWEKFYFRPGNLGYPVFETAVGKVGVYICYDRHFPEGARALGLNGAEIVLIPSATSRGLSEYLWRIEQPSHAVANGYYVGTINRVGIEPIGDDDFYGQSSSATHAARSWAAWPARTRRSWWSATWTWTWSRRSARRGSSTATAVRRLTATWSAPSGLPPEETRHGVRVHHQARALDRADARAHAPGRGGRLRPWLAVRLARALAGAVRPPDAHGAGDDHAPPGHLRDKPRDPRADGHRVEPGRAAGAVGRPLRPRDRPRRLRAPGPGQAADEHGRARGGRPRHPGARGGRLDRVRGRLTGAAVGRLVPASRLDRRLRARRAQADRPDRGRGDAPDRRPRPGPLVRRAGPRVRGGGWPRARGGPDHGRRTCPCRRPRRHGQPDPLVPRARRQPRRGPRQQIPGGSPGGPDPLRPGTPGLRLPPPRGGRLDERGLRDGRHRRPLRDRGRRRCARGQASRPGRGGRRPVQPVPDERQRRRAAGDLRSRDHPGAPRRAGCEGLR